jgi:hypothetical protein
MSRRVRLVSFFAGALVLGALMAWAKGPNGGVGAVAALRTDVGNLSTPWLLLAFLAGAQSSRVSRGALIGLVATMVALFGFYALTSIPVNLGGHTFLGDLFRELRANRIYLAGGLVSGPVFGALGAWWTQRGTLPASLLAGALLIAEPFVTAVATPGGQGSTTWFAVSAAELVVGVGLLVFAALAAQQRRSIP